MWIFEWGGLEFRKFILVRENMFRMWFHLENVYISKIFYYYNIFLMFIKQKFTYVYLLLKIENF